MKRAAGMERASEIPLLKDTAGTEYPTRQAKANCLARHYSQKCSLADEDISPDDLPGMQHLDRHGLDPIHFRLADVRSRLAKLNTSKATGPDNIPARVLAQCSSELAEPVTELFSLCFRHSVQPTKWKLAHVVPIFKKSPRSDPKIYRPVSLLSILSKVIERIGNKQLLNYLERFNILPDSQYGFRQGRGTCDILTALHTEWVKTVSDVGYAHMVAVYIAGAFDRVSHSGLIFKAKNVGIGGCLLHWLQDYLLNRKLSVLVHGDSSSPAPITAGVPQGSISLARHFSSCMCLTWISACLPRRD